MRVRERPRWTKPRIPAGMGIVRLPGVWVEEGWRRRMVRVGSFAFSWGERSTLEEGEGCAALVCGGRRGCVRHTSGSGAAGSRWWGSARAAVTVTSRLGVAGVLRRWADHFHGYRVEHRDDARGGSEVASTDLDQGRRRGVEEEAIGEPRVSPEERVEAVREREDVVEVGNGKQVLDLRLDPQRLVQALALRTVAVAARVVERTLAAAAVTPSQVSAERRRAARDQRRDHARLVVTESRERSQACRSSISASSGCSARGACPVGQCATASYALAGVSLPRSRSSGLRIW